MDCYQLSVCTDSISSSNTTNRNQDYKIFIPCKFCANSITRLARTRRGRKQAQQLARITSKTRNVGIKEELLDALILQGNFRSPPLSSPKALRWLSGLFLPRSDSSGEGETREARGTSVKGSETRTEEPRQERGRLLASLSLDLRES